MGEELCAELVDLVSVLDVYSVRVTSEWEESFPENKIFRQLTDGWYIAPGEMRFRKWGKVAEDGRMDLVVDIRKKRQFMGDCSEHIGFGT